MNMNLSMSNHSLSVPELAPFPVYSPSEAMPSPEEEDGDSSATSQVEDLEEVRSACGPQSTTRTASRSTQEAEDDEEESMAESRSSVPSFIVISSESEQEDEEEDQASAGSFSTSDESTVEWDHEEAQEQPSNLPTTAGSRNRRTPRPSRTRASCLSSSPLVGRRVPPGRLAPPPQQQQQQDEEHVLEEEKPKASPLPLETVVRPFTVNGNDQEAKAERLPVATPTPSVQGAIRYSGIGGSGEHLQRAGLTVLTTTTTTSDYEDVLSHSIPADLVIATPAPEALPPPQITVPTPSRHRAQHMGCFTTTFLFPFKLLRRQKHRTPAEAAALAADAAARAAEAATRAAEAATRAAEAAAYAARIAAETAQQAAQAAQQQPQQQPARPARPALRHYYSNNGPTTRVSRRDFRRRLQAL